MISSTFPENSGLIVIFAKCMYLSLALPSHSFTGLPSRYAKLDSVLSGEISPQIPIAYDRPQDEKPSRGQKREYSCIVSSEVKNLPLSIWFFPPFCIFGAFILIR